MSGKAEKLRRLGAEFWELVKKVDEAEKTAAASQEAAVTILRLPRGSSMADIDFAATKVSGGAFHTPEPVEEIRAAIRLLKDDFSKLDKITVEHNKAVERMDALAREVGIESQPILAKRVDAVVDNISKYLQPYCDSKEQAVSLVREAALIRRWYQIAFTWESSVSGPLLVQGVLNLLQEIDITENI